MRVKRMDVADQRIQWAFMNPRDGVAILVYLKFYFLSCQIVVLRKGEQLTCNFVAVGDGFFRLERKPGVVLDLFRVCHVLLQATLTRSL